MANLSDLSTVITDMFAVIGTLISEVVTLLTGDLLVLAVVGALVALIVGLIYTFLAYIKTQMNNSIKMRK